MIPDFIFYIWLKLPFNYYSKSKATYACCSLIYLTCSPSADKLNLMPASSSNLFIYYVNESPAKLFLSIACGSAYPS